jgi:hypothetical protein
MILVQLCKFEYNEGDRTSEMDTPRTYLVWLRMKLYRIAKRGLFAPGCFTDMKTGSMCCGNTSAN